MFVAREQRLALLGKNTEGNGERSLPGGAPEPIQATSELIGRRWSTGIVNRLSGGPQRFNRLKTSLSGISSKTLSVNLKQLEREGIIRRKEVGDRPLRVEYELTDKGRDFVSVLEAMNAWGAKWLATPSS
jgi:DNA-binding HxlR family transcriptional regulator